MHIESLKWLKDSLITSKTKKNIVVTHHAPGIKSVSEEHKNDLISAAFASNLEKFIKDLKPDLWIHGHIHKFSDYYIEKTRVICNLKGYPDEKVNGYQENLTIEI